MCSQFLSLNVTGTDESQPESKHLLWIVTVVFAKLPWLENSKKTTSNYLVFLQIGEGIESFLVYRGLSLPPTYVSSSSRVDVSFVTDFSTTDIGFSLTYRGNSCLVNHFLKVNVRIDLFGMIFRNQSWVFQYCILWVSKVYLVLLVCILFDSPIWLTDCQINCPLDIDTCFVPCWKLLDDFAY